MATEDKEKVKAALREAGYDTRDAGTGSKSFTPAWVGKETGVSSRQAAKAGHVARDDMAKSGGEGVPKDRHSK